MIVPPLLREDPRFRRFWLGQSISLLGDQVSVIALPLVAVLALDASAAQMGYLVAAELAPNLLFALHAGAWVDRRERKRQIMIATDLGRAAPDRLAPGRLAFDALTFPHMLVVAFLMGSLSVLFQVSYSPLYVALVPRERLDRGRLDHAREPRAVVRRRAEHRRPARAGHLGAGRPSSSTPGPTSSRPSSSGASRSRSRRPRPRGRAMSSRACAGCSATRSSARRWAPPRRSTSSTSSSPRSSSSTRHQSLGVAPGTLGLVLGAGAVGGVLGAVVTGRVARRIGVGPTFAVGCVVFPAPLLLVPLAEGPRWVILACLFLAEFGSGLGVMMLDISVGAIFAVVDPRPASLARLRRLHGRELRRPPARRARRRSARNLDRPARDALDRDRGRPARGPVAAAVADPRAPGAAGARGRRRLRRACRSGP